LRIALAIRSRRGEEAMILNGVTNVKYR